MRGGSRDKRVEAVGSVTTSIVTLGRRVEWRALGLRMGSCRIERRAQSLWQALELVEKHVVFVRMCMGG